MTLYSSYCFASWPEPNLKRALNACLCRHLKTARTFTASLSGGDYCSDQVHKEEISTLLYDFQEGVLKAYGRNANRLLGGVTKINALRVPVRSTNCNIYSESKGRFTCTYVRRAPLRLTRSPKFKATSLRCYERPLMTKNGYAEGSMSQGDTTVRLKDKKKRDHDSIARGIENLPTKMRWGL